MCEPALRRHARDAPWREAVDVEASREQRIAEPEPRPGPAPEENRYPQRWSELAPTERSAVEHMAVFFNLGLPETILLYHLSQALQRHDTPIDAVPLQLEMPQPQTKAVNSF